MSDPNEFDEGPGDFGEHGGLLPDAICEACGKRGTLVYVDAYDFDGDRLEFYICDKCMNRWDDSGGEDIIGEVLERRENEADTEGQT